MCVFDPSGHVVSRLHLWGGDKRDGAVLWDRPYPSELPPFSHSASHVDLNRATPNAVAFLSPTPLAVKPTTGAVPSSETLVDERKT